MIKGYTYTISTDNIHHKTKGLKIKDYPDIRYTQLTVSACPNQQQSLNYMADYPPKRKNIKTTLHKHYQAQILQSLQNQLASNQPPNPHTNLSHSPLHQHKQYYSFIHRLHHFIKLRGYFKYTKMIKLRT